MTDNSLSVGIFFCYLKHLVIWLIFSVIIPCLFLLFSNYVGLKAFYSDLLIVCSSQLAASLYLASGLFNFSQNSERKPFAVSICFLYIILLLLYKKYLDFLISYVKFIDIKIVSVIFLIGSLVVLAWIQHSEILQTSKNERALNNPGQQAQSRASNSLFGATEAIDNE